MPTHCRQQCCPRIMQAKEPTLMCGHALTAILAISSFCWWLQKRLYYLEEEGERSLECSGLINPRAFFLCCFGCWVAIYLCMSPGIREAWDSKISKAGRFYTLLAPSPIGLSDHGSQAIWLPSDPETELVLLLTIQSSIVQPFYIIKAIVESWLIWFLPVFYATIPLL